MGTFSDPLETNISFIAPETFSDLDLDKNSDNFQGSSTGVTLYPESLSDDDDLARRTVYGYVKKNTDWRNVFVMNTPIRKYIAGNVFNAAPDAVTASNTQTGYLRLDIDNPYNIRVMELDTARFDDIKELRVLTGSIASFSTGGIGWLMPDLSLSNSKVGAKVFDLKNTDHAIFLSFSGNLTNTGVDFLRYSITMENEFGSGVYITPLNETEGGIMEYLGTDIIIDRENDYRYKEFKVVRENPLPLPESFGCLFGTYFFEGDCLLY